MRSVCTFDTKASLPQAIESVIIITSILTNRISNFRQETFKTLAENCLKSERKKKVLLCNKAEHYDWIACMGCDQWMHCFCAKTTKEGDTTTISLFLLKYKKT